MRVFVTGGTGAVGRPTVRQLVAAGHDVTALARSTPRAAEIEAAGAEPFLGTLFDRDALAGAMSGHDAVANLATSIPVSLLRSSTRRGWAANDRIRSEGARAVAGAASDVGVERLVQESICFPYVDAGNEWIDEEAPWRSEPYSRTVNDAETAALSHPGAVVLRFAQFYGPDSAHMKLFRRLLHLHISPLVGRQEAHWSLIHTEDAASAVLAALELPRRRLQRRRRLAGEPSIPRERDGRGGGRRPRPLPARPSGPALASRAGAHTLAPSVEPQAPFHRLGAVPPNRHRRVGDSVGGNVMRFRIAAAVLLVGDLLIGSWALFAPQSFYDDFPGAGRSWVSVDGPFNEHLLRDVGALNLALAVVALAAVLRPGRFARLCGISHLVWTVPHLYYHSSHLHLFSTSDAVANVVMLSVPVIASIFLVVFRAPDDEQPIDVGPSTA